MAANTALNVTGLNFDEIRNNLKTFIAAKPDFADYNFEDSAIGTLLDLLAYNTYYNAFYVNMAASEAFLDSAQFYDSVASRAKMIGYTPSSARGATANVRISFTTATATPSSPTLTIAKNTRFTSTINGVSYTFVTPQSYTIAANSSNRFQTDIELVEGLPLTHRFLFTTSNTAFVLPNDKVDTRSMTVLVTTGANTETYVQADDINTVNSSAKIFYLEADRDRKYKVAFGDNVLGKRPSYNSTVAVTYRVCNATKANGANNFTASGTVAGQTSFTIKVNERASGGSDQESIESVRFNAPRSYETQNRAVTSQDYQRLILRDNSDLQAVSVWGGQENDPPIYGKVFATVKPKQGTLISSARKQQIITAIKKYNVQAIDLEIVDPTFLYIIPNVTVQYDPTQTTRTGSEIANLVANRIIAYETNNFSRFDSKFWYSKFLNYLDLADNSIVSTTAIIDIQKRFQPSTSSRNTYSFRFNTPILSLGEAESLSTVRGGSSQHPGFGWLTSSSFTYAGFTSYLEDNGFGTVRIYYRDNSVGRLGRIYTNFTAGTVNYITGLVTLSNFLPSAYSGDEIKINVRPKSQNIQSVRNQLLFFADSSVSVIDSNTGKLAYKLTTVATAGQSSTLNESALAAVTSY